MKEKILELLKVAEIHITRLNLAIQHLSNLLPFTADKIGNFTDNEIAWIELFISRFGKLQDFLGSKIFDLFLTEIGENIDNHTMIDKLHKLERIGIIENSTLWKEMRNIRNNISHEYPDHPELTAKSLNKLIILMPKLIDIVMQIKTTLLRL